jgi:hypothetical protein
MGVTVQIGDTVLDLSSVMHSWLEDQIGRRKRDNQPICVIVRIQEAGLDIKLATQACGGSGGGGGRAPYPREQDIINLWNEKHLSTGDLSAGHFYSFIQHLRRLV